jgi:hypothetical protein
MGTIRRFEDLEIWRQSRELCNEVYHIIESTQLKNNFRLCNQIDGSSGSVMDNIAGSKETEIKNLSSFFQLQKLPVEKQVHSCIGFMIENLFHRKNPKL